MVIGQPVVKKLVKLIMPLVSFVFSFIKGKVTDLVRIFLSTSFVIIGTVYAYLGGISGEGITGGFFRKVLGIVVDPSLKVNKEIGKLKERSMSNA